MYWFICVCCKMFLDEDLKLDKSDLSVADILEKMMSEKLCLFYHSY